MKILVANLGSTSFKYRLFDMNGEQQLAKGSIERIGASESQCAVEIGDYTQEEVAAVPDHAEAVRKCLSQLTDAEHGCLSDASEVAAIGFKAVHGGRKSGVVQVDDEVLDAMREMNLIAPAHNPPYIAAMEQMRKRLPDIPLVAAFETGFHETIPQGNRNYAIPFEWIEDFQVRRFGFHGASHRYVGTRVAELLERDELRVISCHLGGSSSVTAIRNGESVATSMGASPQTGLPQNNRVGDFDPFTLPHLMERTGLSLEDVLKKLSSEGGLLGLSGISADIRDVRKAASGGDARAQLALDVLIGSIRQYVGWMLVELGGADVIAFTGGIGEHGPDIRSGVCRGLTELGIELDEEANANASGEVRISAADSRAEIWIVPTNEELIVARQTQALIEAK